MTTEDLFRLADLCIEAGYFPKLVDRKYVLSLGIPGRGWGTVHRKHVNFRLHSPCQVYCMSGKVRCFLGESSSLPADLSSGVRPPYTH